MAHLKTIKAGACLAALLIGSAASAAVTAAEVWENLESNLDIYGDDGVSYEVDTDANGTVTVSDLTLTMSDDDVSVSTEIGDLVFSENGDGTVDIDMADSYAMNMKDDNGDGFKMIIGQSGLEITASGVPDAINYDLSAEQYTVILDEVIESGEVVPADIRFAINDLAGAYQIAMGDIRNIAYNMTAATVDLLFNIEDDGNMVVMSGKIADVFVDADVDLPDMSAEQDPENLFVEGLRVDARYGLGQADYIFEIVDDQTNVTGTVSNGNAQASVAIDKGEVSYDASSTDIAFRLNPGMLPFPVNVDLAEYGISFAVPLAKADDPTDFGLSLNLTDLTINDEIWMMGDPAGQLPRDPITAKLDVSGMAKLFFDLLDPSQADAIEMAEVPGELHSVKLNDLTLKAVGAAISGKGAFTFDNSDFETIPDIPRPEGEVTLNIDGANQLMDTLVGMGLLPEDQAMGARMMLGMFARSVGDDQLTSTVEINEQGHIIANGQRIR